MSTDSPTGRLYPSSPAIQELPQKKRVVTPEDRTLIIDFFLGGYGMNHIVFLLDYRLTIADVNMTIREKLREALACPA